MALRLCSSDTSTDEEGGRRAGEGTLEGGGVCKGREKVDTMKRKPAILRHKFKSAGRNVCNEIISAGLHDCQPEKLSILSMP